MPRGSVGEQAETRIPVLTEPARRRAEFRELSTSRRRAALQAVATNLEHVETMILREPRGGHAPRQRSVPRKENVCPSDRQEKRCQSSKRTNLLAKDNIYPSEHHRQQTLKLVTTENFCVPDHQQAMHVPKEGIKVPSDRSLQQLSFLRSLPCTGERQQASTSAVLGGIGKKNPIFVDPEFALAEHLEKTAGAASSAAHETVVPLLELCAFAETGHEAALGSLLHQLQMVRALRRPWKYGGEDGAAAVLRVLTRDSERSCTHASTAAASAGALLTCLYPVATQCSLGRGTSCSTDAVCEGLRAMLEELGTTEDGAVHVHQRG